MGVPPFPHRTAGLCQLMLRGSTSKLELSLCSHIQLKVPGPLAASLPGGLAIRGGNHTDTLNRGAGPQPTHDIVKGVIHRPFVLGCESMLLNHRAGLPPARPLTESFQCVQLGGSSRDWLLITHLFALIFLWEGESLERNGRSKAALRAAAGAWPGCFLLDLVGTRSWVPLRGPCLVWPPGPDWCELGTQCPTGVAGVAHHVAPGPLGAAEPAVQVQEAGEQ